MEKKLNEMLEAERQKFLSVEASVQNQIAELQQSGSIRSLPTPTTPDPTRFISSPPVPERTRAPSTPVTPPPAHAPVHVPRLEASLPAVPVCGAKQPTAAIRSQTSVRPSTAPLKLEEPAPKKTKTVQILEDKVGKRTRSEAQPDEALISFNVLILWIVCMEDGYHVCKRTHTHTHRCRNSLVATGSERWRTRPSMLILFIASVWLSSLLIRQDIIKIVC